MKMRNKGKVHPSPSSTSSSSSSSCNGSNRVDASAVLKLLPAAILTLVSILSMEDREVFAYMVTKSLKSGPNSFPVESEKKRNSKKSNNTHKPPVFDCDCFDCYTSFWYRWDSSPNRELIHQAIEAFEEHLEAEQSPKKPGRARKREKFARRGAAEKPAEAAAAAAVPDLAEIEDSFVVVESENVDATMAAALGEGTAGFVEAEVVKTAAAEVEEEQKEDVAAEAVVVVDEEAAVMMMRSPPAGNSSHKGFARKMLPDVVGLLNSRLWSLWSPDA